MRVLHILNELQYSGAEVMLKDAAPCFREVNIDSYILSVGAIIGPYASTLRDAGYNIEHIPFSPSLTYLYKFYSYIRKMGFDAVHIHPERSFFWHALIAKIAGVPRIVRTIHDVFPFHGYLRVERWIQRFIARVMLKVKFIAISKSVEEQEFVSYRNPTVIIWNWVDTKRFCPPTEEERIAARQSFGLSDGDFAFVTVGTCNDKKNHTAIFDCLNLLSSINNFDHFFFLHRGSGPNLELEKEYVEKLGLSKQVKFIGYLANIREVLIAADLFVMSSPWEGLGNVVLEAMSVGLPVVLYDVPGLKDFNHSQKGGFWVKPNSEALVEPIVRLSKQKELKLRLGKEARQIILDNFDMVASLTHLMKLYGFDIQPGIGNLPHKRLEEND